MLILGKIRGRKLLRVARRVSGLLLQLVVFEMPKPPEKTKKEESSEEQKVGTNEDEDYGVDIQNKLNAARLQRKKIVVHEAPSLRILGYDPRSKQRSVIIVSPEAVTEVAGGEHSTYLEVERRRELGRIVCESLQLTHPREGGFELVVPWSKSEAVVAGAIIGGKKSWRASADRVIQRPGKLYRSGVRISGLDLIVSVYSSMTKKEDGTPDNGAIFNFYAQVASETTEILLPELVQVEYMGKPMMAFIPGDTRAIAIKNMCKYFTAYLDENSRDPSKKTLHVELLPKKKGFIDDYKEIGLPIPGTDVRPSGIPTVFMPPDAAGTLFYRQSTRIFVKEENKMSKEEYLVSVYSRTKKEGPERGMVVKVYDTEISQTIVLHIAPSEVTRIVEGANCTDILKELALAREMNVEVKADSLEKGFLELTERGEIIKKINQLTSIICDITVKDIGITVNSQGEKCLYSLGSTFIPT